ncbi:hypothetical protein Aph02nite_25110 [Actinoplanes philippinensis]|nr:hypothetical protein Aph02nite_25110 [Actinoplanes philippinensis]
MGEMRRLWIAVGTNLVLGVPGIVSIFLTYYYLGNGPLAGLHWPVREPTENDGLLALSLTLVPVILGSALIWVGVNYLLWRNADVPARWFWPACALVAATPFLVVTSL